MDYEGFDYFFRHLVGLRIKYVIDSQEHSKILSTFLFHHRGRAFLITAGHNFERSIKDALNLSPSSNVQFSLVDYVLKNSKFKFDIPFERTFLQHSPFSTDTNSFDFGFIPLLSTYSEQLTSNDLCHLSEEYIPDGSENFEAFFICGFPEEMNDMERKGKFGKIGFGVKHITKLATPPKNTEIEYPADTFFGKIEMNSDLTDIKGMSGGPIFGLLRNSSGVQEYRLCAIQESWIKNRTIIVGCSISAMLFHLNKYCDKLEA